MITVADKAIAAFLPGVLLWLNQKYGFKFDTSPETMAAITGFIGAIAVYYVPNLLRPKQDGVT